MKNFPLFFETGPKFIAADLYDDENGETKYSVQSFLYSPEELTLLKPMHIWTNAFTANGDQTVDMNMFNQLSEAGIVVGSRFEVSDVNVDALLQNTINEQIMRKFGESIGFGIGYSDAKESSMVLKTLFEKVKTLIGMVEQEPRNVISITVNALTNGGISGENNGIEIQNENEWAVNQSVDLHLMDLISRTVIDCIQAGAIACENDGQHCANPLLYEIISQVLAKNLSLHSQNANKLGESEVSFNAIERLLASPEAALQIENRVKMLAAKTMQTNKIDLIKAMINGNPKSRIHNEIRTETRSHGAEIQPQTETQRECNGGTQHEADILENICGLLRNDTIDELHESVRNLICHEPTMMHHIVTEMQKQTDNLVSESAIAQILRKCIVSAVQQLTNDDIKQIVSTPGQVSDEKFSTYLTDTISLARALGLTNCILHLSNIINGNGVAIEQLEGDTDTFELLQRVIVMHKLSLNDKKRQKALELLRDDPYSARSDIVLRELLRCSGICALNLEEGKKLTDSNDVPISLIYSQNQLAIAEFFLRTQTKPRGAILIVKDRFQAVVPRESSRDVLTGKCAYTVLDENGIRHFEPLHMFTALKLKNVTMFANRFASYSTDTENEKDPKNQPNNNGFDIDIDQILNMGAITTASNNGFIAYKSTLLPRKEFDLLTKRRYGTPHELIFDRNQVKYRRSFYL